jgi:hypothetical protein
MLSFIMYRPTAASCWVVIPASDAKDGNGYVAWVE